MQACGNGVLMKTSQRIAVGSLRASLVGGARKGQRRICVLTCTSHGRIVTGLVMLRGWGGHGGHGYGCAPPTSAAWISCRITGRLQTSYSHYCACCLGAVSHSSITPIVVGGSAAGGARAEAGQMASTIATTGPSAPPHNYY
jgi:hypothetical protein